MPPPALPPSSSTSTSTPIAKSKRGNKNTKSAKSINPTRPASTATAAKAPGGGNKVVEKRPRAEYTSTTITVDKAPAAPTTTSSSSSSSLSKPPPPPTPAPAVSAAVATGGSNGKGNGNDVAAAKKKGLGLKFSWNSQEKKYRVVVVGEGNDFEPAILDHLKEEGFSVTYVPFNGQYVEDSYIYHKQLLAYADGLGLGERWAIVAFGDAAAVCLQACMRPMAKLAVLVAYYPTQLPELFISFPSSIHVQIHLAGPVQISMPDAEKFSKHVFTYPSVEPGFAEDDVDEFDKTASRLAWTRTLSALRKAFELDVDLEKIWENHTDLEFGKRDAEATMKTMVAEPYVNHIPTMTGGIGHQDLLRFYRDYFIPGNPPDTKMKLLSRTIGTDRIVDEMKFTFTHTQEVPWMLPSVPATGKKVEVALVSIVCIRGGKLYHEHIYWDQASALIQIGLLDPNLIPKGFRTTEKGKEKDIKRLPVVGAEAVRKVEDEEDGESNRLIASW